MEYISCIENIFQNRNIYKSIFICKSGLLNDCYEVLKKYDYPICKLCEKEKFNQHMSRILIIDESDLNEIDTHILLSEVSVVICIENENKIKQLDNIPHIFL